MTDQITSEPTSLAEAFKEMAACAQDHPAAEPWMYKFADLILAKLSLPSPPVSGEAVAWRHTSNGRQWITKRRQPRFENAAGDEIIFSEPLFNSPLTNEPVGVTETWQTACDWLETTFGPIKPERIITRAKEEFEELESAETLEQQTIEAADVVMCLMRFPGLWEALVAKMAVNRARTWELRGDGTGYHVKNLSAAIGERG